MTTSYDERIQDAEQHQARMRPVPLWRNHDYVLLLSGQGVSAIGTQISQLAFPLLMLALTHSPAQAGFLGAVRLVPYLLLSLPAGALVDRWDRKRLMILCDMGRAVVLGSIPLALALGHLALWQLYAVSLVEGTLFVFFNLAEVACLPRVVTSEQLPTVTAQNNVVMNLAFMIGPSVGGALFAVSRALPFVGDAVSYTASFGSLFFMRRRFQGDRKAETRPLRDEIFEGLHWLWHNPLIRFMAVLTGGSSIITAGISLIIIVLAQDAHASTFVIGLIFAGGSIGGLLGAVVGPWIQRRYRFAVAVLGSSWIWALSWPLYALAHTPLLLGILTAIAFGMGTIYDVTQFSYRIALIPDALQGRVNSVYRLLIFGGQPLGLALTGVLLQTVGPQWTVLIFGVPLFALTIAASFNRDILHAGRVGEPAA